MVEETKDVTAESSSALGEAIASSPEALEEQQTPETETSTPQEDVTQEQETTTEEEPRVPYSRLKEVVDEKNWYKTQLEERLKLQPQQQQPTTKEEFGNTPEEREFWRMQRQIAREEAQKELKQISPIIDAGRLELAQLKVQQFRAAHPDIKANSPEEIEIANKIQAGYLPEDAYKVVMYGKVSEAAQKKANSSVKQKIEAKKQANVEQRSISSGGTPPVKEKLTLRQQIEREAEKLEF